MLLSFGETKVTVSRDPKQADKLFEQTWELPILGFYGVKDLLRQIAERLVDLGKVLEEEPLWYEFAYGATKEPAIAFSSLWSLKQLQDETFYSYQLGWDGHIDEADQDAYREDDLSTWLNLNNGFRIDLDRTGE